MSGLKLMENEEDLEVFCYETDDGQICLEFGVAALSFSKERFVELANHLNQVRLAILCEHLEKQSSKEFFDYQQL
jgi:hypothetical protein